LSPFFIHMIFIDMLKKILLSENERNTILSLYEQEKKDATYTPKKFPLQNLGDTFDYGKYESEKAKTAINSMKPKIDEFINTSESSNFIVTINAGESQVTNPKGFEEQGSLARARAEQIKKYFEEIFADQIKNGKMVVKVGDVKVGTTPYTKGDQTKPDLMKKYKQEQFIYYDITGTGETRKPFDFCKGGKKDQRGKFIPSKKMFTEMTDWNLGYGEGQFYLYSDALTMPDILYFEYDGVTFFDKTVGDVVSFRGEDSPWTRLLIGTALVAKFGEGGGLPPQFGNTTFQKIDINKYSNALLEVKSKGGWSLKDSFTNVYGTGQEFDNPKYMKAFEDFDNGVKIKKVIKELGVDFPWGYLTSPILPSVAKNIPIFKKDGIDTIKIINVAPNGGTAWNVGTTCTKF